VDGALAFQPSKVAPPLRVGRALRPPAWKRLEAPEEPFPRIRPFRAERS
jgi:hypothetical protein